MDEARATQMSWTEDDVSIGVSIVSAFRYHSAMGICLARLQAGLGEIAHWKDVSNAKEVYGVIEGVGFSPSQMGGCHYLGEFVAPVEQSLELFLLVGGGFVAPKVFDGFGAGKEVYANIIASGVGQFQWNWWCLF